MLNNHDIQDYTSEFCDLQPAAQPKKLYELPRGSFFKLPDYDWLIRLNNIDGAFSHCTVLEGENKGGTAHIVAYALVTPWVKPDA